MEDIEDADLTLDDVIHAIAEGVYNDVSTLWDGTLKMNVFRGRNSFTIMENCG